MDRIGRLNEQKLYLNLNVATMRFIEDKNYSSVFNG